MAKPIPGNAMCDSGSAASDILRMTAKLPTKPAAMAIAIESTADSRLMDVVPQRRAVEVLKHLRRQSLLRRAKAGLGPTETQDVIAIAVNDREVVGNEKDGQALFMLQSMQQRVDLLLPRLINAGR